MPTQAEPSVADAAAARGSVLLRATGISKRFGITQALDSVTVEFRAGEIHALMGENGAGKSTLGKVISGLHRQDEGTVEIGGRELEPGSIEDAFAAGIRIVHQELAQCPNLSVAENLSLHAMPTRGPGIINRRAMIERAARLVHKIEPGIDVTAPLGLLSPGHRQICQIAASLDDRVDESARARVIVFDEPTSSLSVAEADRLLEITRQLAREGLTIIYVSHRMSEIFAVCDRVSVLRDGKFIATSDVKSIDEAGLVEQMIGRRLDHGVKRTPPALEPSRGAMLEVRNISSPGRLSDVSLSVAPGEILGIGGLVGCGRSELLNAIFGLDTDATGLVRVDGREVPRESRAMISAGVGYVPEDRRNQGLFFLLGIDENIVMPFMARLASLVGVRSMAGERRVVLEKTADFQVKAASLRSQPGELSGGNQQKLLLARWMGKSTRVLLLDEPTRGIDVGTKAEIYRLVKAAADAGTAVLLVSSEMPELLALSDRVVVMSEGRLTGELRGNEMTQSNILRLAAIENGRG
jgi:ABC-type sugar transport system ATPase subunit